MDNHEQGAHQREQGMSRPATAHVSASRVELAPDGSRVRPLLSLGAGGMAQFELAAGEVTRAVRHRSVAEIWLVLAGIGEMWRQHEEYESVVALEPGVCLTVPAGTAFQFRCTGDAPLHIAAVTMPPWPGDSEAIVVAGKWR